MLGNTTDKDVQNKIKAQLRKQMLVAVGSVGF